MIVDVHGHITPPELLERFPMPKALGDVDGMVERKAEAGIDLTIVGSPVGVGTMVPVPGLDNFAQSDDGLSRFHDWLAETVHRHSGRLRAYAYVNPFGDDDHLARAAATVRDDAFVGFLVNTSVRGEYLDSERADGFFALAEELDLPVFLHPPAEPVGSESLRDFRLVEQVARYCDITAGLAALIFAGRLARQPRLRIVAAMAGGALALLFERLDAAHEARRPGPPENGEPALAEPPSAYLRRVYVDTATPNTPALTASLQAFGPARLLFGTDSPPSPYSPADALASVDALGLDAADRERVLGGNARELFALDGVRA